MTEEKLKNRKPNRDKLPAFGFKKTGTCYVYHTDLADGQMTLTVTIDEEGTIRTRVADSNGDEYVLHRVTGAAGAFVGRIKSDFDAVMKEISEQCFEPDVFKSEQAKAVIAYVRDRYGDSPEFLWKEFPDNAVVRRKDNQKWYAAFLTVSRRKLGLASDETTEIIDLRVNPGKMESTVDNLRYFPGYHMNKKHWITICLDNTVNTEEICRRIDESYLLAQK